MSTTTEIRRLTKLLPRKYRTLATFLITLVVIGGSLLLANYSNQLSTQNPISVSISTDTYVVADVVDGDTFKIYLNNKLETVRMIGIDTPETVDPRKTVQCFGLEASNRLKQLLTGKQVYIASDSTQSERDQYNRLLLYVWLPQDGGSKLFINKQMIADGYAHEYTYNVPYQYQAEFKQSEKEAREAMRGLWGSCPAKI
jgi:micrococcal nuclease